MNKFSSIASKLLSRNEIKLAKRILALGYEPYKGPAGPSYDQAEANTKALYSVLRKKGVRAQLVSVPIWFGDDIEDLAQEGTSAMMVEIKTAPTNIDPEGLHLWAMYDRWGFIAGTFIGPEEVDTQLDQAPFKKTVEWILGLYQFAPRTFGQG